MTTTTHRAAQGVVRPARPPRVEAGFLLAGAFPSALVLATVLGRTDAPTAAATAAFAVLVGVCACLGRPAATLAVAVMAWSLLTGFVVHALGTLTFAPADLRRLAVLLAVAGLTAAARAARQA